MAKAWILVIDETHGPLAGTNYLTCGLGLIKTEETWMLWEDIELWDHPLAPVILDDPKAAIALLTLEVNDIDPRWYLDQPKSPKRI